MKTMVMTVCLALAGLLALPVPTADAGREMTAAERANAAGILSRLVYTDVSVDFVDTPSQQVFEYLQRMLGITIHVGFSDDRHGIGIDPEMPITLKLDQQPALVVVERVLEQCDDLEECTWQFRNGMFEVSTKERLGRPVARYLQYYPIQDLLFEVPNFDNAPDLNLGGGGQGGGQGGGGGGGGGMGGGGMGGGGMGGGQGGGGQGGGGQGQDAERMTQEERLEQLITIIQDFVEPDEWVDRGGDSSTIRAFQGVLIIRAPDFVHRQLGGYNFVISAPSQLPSHLRRQLSFSTEFTVIDGLGVATPAMANDTTPAP
jgi:hypothetical protein